MPEDFGTGTDPAAGGGSSRPFGRHDALASASLDTGLHQGGEGFDWRRRTRRRVQPREAWLEGGLDFDDRDDDEALARLFASLDLTTEPHYSWDGASHAGLPRLVSLGGSGAEAKSREPQKYHGCSGTRVLLGCTIACLVVVTMMTLVGVNTSELLLANVYNVTELAQNEAKAAVLPLCQGDQDIGGTCRRRIASEAEAQKACRLMNYTNAEQPKLAVTEGLTIATWEDALGVLAPVTIDAACANPEVRGPLDKAWRSVADQELLGGMTHNQTFVYLRCNNTFTPGKWFMLTPDIGNQLIVKPPLAPPSTVTEAQLQPPLFGTVVTVLLDAVSRAKFEYMFPKSFSWLHGAGRNAASTHEAFLLRRYTVLGGNSPPNKVPLYAGHYVWDHDATPPATEVEWLWHVAEDNGFATGFVDGSCEGRRSAPLGKETTPGPHEIYQGDIGHWVSKNVDGRGQVPAQVRWPQYALCMGALAKFQHELSNNCTITEGTKDKFQTLGAGGDKAACGGNRMWFNLGLDWIKRFLSINSNRKRLAHFTTLETHDGDTWRGLDDALVKLFTDLFEPKAGDPYKMGNAAVFVLSDHGQHYMREYSRRVGKIYHKQPVGYWIVPKAALRENPKWREYFVKAGEVVTTHFDTHETIRHMLTGAPRQSSGGVAPDSATYGKSILDGAMPQRSCSEAGVDKKFCPCGMFACDMDHLPVMGTNDAEVKQLFVDFVNKQIAAQGLREICAPYSNRTILSLSPTLCTKVEWGEVRGEAMQLKISLSKHHGKKGIQLNLMRPTGAAKPVVDQVVTTSPYKDHWKVCEPKISELKGLRPGAINDIKDLYFMTNICYCGTA